MYAKMYYYKVFEKNREIFLNWNREFSNFVVDKDTLPIIYF